MVRFVGSLIKRLFADLRGGTAVTFGLMAIPLALIALGAVDYARLSLLKTQLQEAVDTAALMAARSSAKTDADIDKVGDAAFLEHLKAADVQTPTATFKAGPDNAIIATASGSIRPIIMALIGKVSMKAEVETEIKRAKGTPVELALVLDTTGSMSGQPLKDLQAAAKDLVAKMHKAAEGKNLKIGVVPFGQYVNVGVSRRNESWVSVPADYSEKITPACTTQTSQTTCKTETYACTKYNDGKPYSSTCSKSVDCVSKLLIPPKLSCPAPYTNTYKFSGCVGSPAYPKNVRDDDPMRVYPGFLNLTCAAEITPLTASETTVTSAIKSLSASGLTYIPSGLAWGYNMLSSPKPLTEAAVYDKTGANLAPRKALVLMTDGANTVLMNKANGRHDKSPATGSPATEADTYTAELCKNIKGDKIEVFTVAFNLDDAAAKKMLQACATDAEHFFDATDGVKLQAAFADIAESLRNLYIAK